MSWDYPFASLKPLPIGEPVRLFGSRLDDAKRGGDIDLYIESPFKANEAFSEELAMTADIWQVLGERKIDIVVSDIGKLRCCRSTSLG